MQGQQTLFENRYIQMSNRDILLLLSVIAVILILILGALGVRFSEEEGPK